MTTQARLRAFVAVADTGSVREAAERLYITESGISAAINALAGDVGVALFERDGRGIRLTAAGKIYAGYARTILGLHEEAVGAARDQVGTSDALVRIAAVTTAAEQLLPELLASFRRVHPRVRLRLEVAPRDRVWPMLAHHEADLVVAGRPPDGLRARTRATFPNTLIVVGRPGEPSAERATWLLREEGSGTRATCLAVLGALELEPPALTLGSHGAVVAGARAGLGVTMVPREAVAAQLAAGTLVELPLDGTPLSRPWHAVTQLECPASTELLIGELLRAGWSEAEPGDHGDDGQH